MGSQRMRLKREWLMTGSAYRLVALTAAPRLIPHYLTVQHPCSSYHSHLTLTQPRLHIPLHTPSTLSQPIPSTSHPIHIIPPYRDIISPHTTSPLPLHLVSPHPITPYLTSLDTFASRPPPSSLYLCISPLDHTTQCSPLDLTSLIPLQH